MSDGISMNDLKAILAEQSRQNAEQLKEIIEAIRKPTVIEQEQLDKLAEKIRSDNENRKSLAGAVKGQIEGKQRLQHWCSHEHPNGNTHCVYIQEPRGNGYLLCQKNQCIIRPGIKPENYKGNDLFDTVLFNKIFQQMQSMMGDIIG
jgi:hypothetical protein